MPDLERLQTSLDAIAGTVEWAAKWMEVLEDDARENHSDLPILEADAERLRAVADALVPGRVRDPSSGKRWYLAPDEALQREGELERALEAADAKVARVTGETERSRDAAERSKLQSRERQGRQDAEREGRSDLVLTFLREHGPATVKEIAAGTGLTPSMAEITAGGVAKRGRDRRFRLEQ